MVLLLQEYRVCPPPAEKSLSAGLEEGFLGEDIHSCVPQSSERLCRTQGKWELRLYPHHSIPLKKKSWKDEEYLQNLWVLWQKQWPWLLLTQQTIPILSSPFIYYWVINIDFSKKWQNLPGQWHYFKLFQKLFEEFSKKWVFDWVFQITGSESRW